MIDNKQVQDYLFSDTRPVVGHIPIEEFELHPATALLDYTLVVKDAIEKCKKSFSKKANNHLTVESQVAIQNLINSALASIMGYFEMYEKYLFAAMFEKSLYLNTFNENNFYKNTLGKTQNKVEIPFTQLTSYRNSNVTTGLIIANSLGNWHDPEKVNTYFQSFGFKVTAFSNDDIRDLKVLWQLRHSIVHNGATITKADAQKVEELKTFGNRKIILSNKFIYDLSKSMHSMVFNVNSRLKHAFLMNMLATVTQDERDQVEKIFEVTSRNSFWLR
jgi:hypothetical protein